MQRMTGLMTAVVALLALATLSATADVRTELSFTPAETRMIREYYQAIPPIQAAGKKRPKAIPPGIARNLARGKSLPPGIARQVLPSSLEQNLPPVKRGFERVVVDGKVLLVEVATQVIHDVLSGLIIR